MSVKYAKGDLLDFTHWNVIAHCANCTNTFGSGLALQIRERYPVAYEADTEAYTAVNPTGGHIPMAEMLGEFSVANVGEGRRIVNLYGQAAYGRDRRHLDYDAFYNALKELKTSLEIAHIEGRIYTLGLPHRIGSDRAGGDWRIIEVMIHALFDESPIQVYIVERENA